MFHNDICQDTNPRAIIFLTILVPIISIILFFIPSSPKAVSHPPQKHHTWWGLGIFMIHLVSLFIFASSELTTIGKESIVNKLTAVGPQLKSQLIQNYNLY